MPLPSGHACVFYIQGVCFHPEAARPGFDPAWRCVRLTQLLERWDDFLDRAEAFGLAEETAARIWSARMNGFVLRRKDCPSPARFSAAGAPPPGVEDAEGEALGCPHLWRGVCLLALPECRGACERYRRRG